MRGSPRTLALAGAGLMMLGALGPWAQVQAPSSGLVSVSGLGRGSAVVLVAAVVVVLLQLIGRGRGVPLVGALSAAWTALVMYQLPGSLVEQGAAEAQMSWGSYAALLGALLVTAAIAWAPRPALRIPARPGAFLIVCVTVVCALGSAAWTAPRVGSPSSGDDSWTLHARDDFGVTSADGRARAVAAVEWHHGAFPAGLLHRGAFTPDSVVEALRPVGCLWTRVEWSFALGTVSSSNGGYAVRCKRRGDRKPVAISLAGEGYAKELLNSVTLTLCVSDVKADGPRFCGTQKVTYSHV